MRLYKEGFETVRLNLYEFTSILIVMNRFIGIGKSAKILGVSTQTLRRWENEKRLIPKLTKGGQRRYDIY
ncbi:MerR family DNA-binding transcriptional regulator [Candidatus Dependentiae bacterium]|nr:MerR family DNA-binding transcriptional regulator [Candidatus Dependentiae bacterium]